MQGRTRDTCGAFGGNLEPVLQHLNSQLHRPRLRAERIGIVQLKLVRKGQRIAHVRAVRRCETLGGIDGHRMGRCLWEVRFAHGESVCSDQEFRGVFKALQ